MSDDEQARAALRSGKLRRTPTKSSARKDQQVEDEVVEEEEQGATGLSPDAKIRFAERRVEGYLAAMEAQRLDHATAMEHQREEATEKLDSMRKSLEEAKRRMDQAEEKAARLATSTPNSRGPQQRIYEEIHSRMLDETSTFGGVTVSMAANHWQTAQGGLRGSRNS